MKLIIKISTLILLFNFKSSFGQSKTSCDTLYWLDSYHNMTSAKYAGGQSDLNKYLTNEVIPIISSSYKNDEDKPTNLYISLLINKSGEVVNVDFVKSKLKKSCKDEVEQKLLSMKNWHPAQLKGRPVCSNFIIPINCLKWE